MLCPCVVIGKLWLLLLLLCRLKLWLSMTRQMNLSHATRPEVLKQAILFLFYIDYILIGFVFCCFFYAIVVVVVFTSSSVTFNELLINCSRMMHERIVVVVNL